MNIHLPAILMWTTGVQGFDTLPVYKTTHDWEWFIYTTYKNKVNWGMVQMALFSQPKIK